MSWLDDSTNISDENIKSKIIIASSMIDSAVSNRYSLPLSYHYQNTITFSWTWTNTGTMAIVINGTTYNIWVVLWDTWNTVADKFRVACESSEDFINDSLWFWSQVLLISKSTDNTTAYWQVNITSAPTTQGISASIWTRQIRYTPFLEQLTSEIATALLFIDIYWIESQDTGKDWINRMEAINETLQKIQGTSDTWQIINLFDEVTKQTLENSTSYTTSYPNDTSNESTTDSTSSNITMNKVF